MKSRLQQRNEFKKIVQGTEFPDTLPVHVFGGCNEDVFFVNTSPIEIRQRNKPLILKKREKLLNHLVNLACDMYTPDIVGHVDDDGRLYIYFIR